MRKFAFVVAVALLAMAAVPAFAQTTSTIVQVVDSHANLNTLMSALVAADLTDELSGAGPYTIFAPTDRAFRNLPASELEALNSNPSALRSLLLYHVVFGTVDPAATSVTSAHGGSLSLNTVGNRRTVNGNANVVGSVQAANGVIYLIDRVLTVQAPQATAPAPAPAVPEDAVARNGLNDQVIIVGPAHVFIDPVTHPGQIITPGLGPTICQRVYITETLGEYARIGSPFNGWILQSSFVYPDHNPGC